jgi:hypothetical protein
MRPDLFWSRTGEVCCTKHAPARRSDTWAWGGWRKMTRDEIETMHAEGLQGCEHCPDECDEPPAAGGEA